MYFNRQSNTRKPRRLQREQSPPGSQYRRRRDWAAGRVCEVWAAGPVGSVARSYPVPQDPCIGGIVGEETTAEQVGEGQGAQGG